MVLGVDAPSTTVTTPPEGQRGLRWTWHASHGYNVGRFNTDETEVP